MKQETTASLDQLELVCKALADRTRLRILHLLLSVAELPVSDFVRIIGPNQPKISRHLSYLKRAGLVEVRKDGLWSYYQLSAELVLPIKELLVTLQAGFNGIEALQRDLIQLATPYTAARGKSGRAGEIDRQGKMAETPERNSEILIELL